MRRRRDVWDTIAELLEARGTRLVLAVLIVLSLLPYPAMETALRPLFLLVFGLEIGLRLIVLSKGRARSPRSERLFLVVDLLAYASFLPLQHVFEAPRRFLRILRIARLLVLVRFTRELAGDVYRVLTRREQLQQLGLVSAAVLALSFVAAVLLTNLGVPHDYDGVAASADGFWDHLWWAFRQVESPDNLVQNLRADPLLVLVSLGLTITGIFVFSYLIGIGANVVDQVLRAERRRPVAYRRHTLIMGPVHDAEPLVAEFVAIYKKNRALRSARFGALVRWLTGKGRSPKWRSMPRIALLGEDEEPPSYLYESGMRWVIYRDGNGVDAVDLDRVAAADAKRIVLLAKRDDADADAITVGRLAAFRSLNSTAHAFLEVRESENTDVARAVGGEGTFVLDVPRFVGQFLCHHLLVPGIERLLAELLSSQGHEMYTHVYASRDEVAELDALAQRTAELDFGELAEVAHRRFGVALLGVFLDREQGGQLPAPSAVGRTSMMPADLVPVERTVPWVNPLAEPNDAGLEPFALRAGTVPTAALRGVFGISETYGPMRAFAAALLSGDITTSDGATTVAVAATPPSATRSVVDRLDWSASMGPKTVLVVGRNPALSPLVDSLARFVPGVTVRVVATDPPARFGRAEATALEKGGRCLVYPCDRETVAETAAHVFVREGADAVVFLSDPSAPEPDARTSLRVFHFLRAVDAAGMPSDLPAMDLLVELQSRTDGSPLGEQAQRLGGGRFSVTLISTAQITDYFLVHSAFVPGLMGLYERLLGERGQEIVRLPVAQRLTTSPLTVSELRQQLARRGAIPVALELSEGTLRVDLNPDTHIDGPELRAVFVVADSADLGTC